MGGTHSLGHRARWLRLAALATTLWLYGCAETIDGYLAASSFSTKGFARSDASPVSGENDEVKVWGFVDHANIYGDADARKILGGWWSGESSLPSTWRFDLKARVEDQAGESFPVWLPNDPYRDEVLRVLVTDANRGSPTKVFLTGRLHTFEAPTNYTTAHGLSIEVDSSADVLFAPPVDDGQ